MKPYNKVINFKNVYQAIKTSYLEKINNFAEGQYEHVASQVINDVINESANKKTDTYLVETHLDNALDLLLDLKCAINYMGNVWNENEKIDYLYQDHNWHNGIKPWEHDIPHEVNIILLNEVVSKYLRYEWFSSPIFEWFIINAYLRYCIELNRKNLIYSPPGSARAIAACCSTQLQYMTTFLIFKTIGIVINWILPVFLILIAFIKGWLITSIVLTTIWIVPLFFSIISFPGRRKSQRNKIKMLADLINLKIHVSEKLWSPRFVMNKVKKMNQTFLMPELIPLVSKMIKRDPDVFNVSNGL